MPQPVSYNTGNPVSGSIQDDRITYVVDGQSRDYRGGFGGLSWMSEAPAIGNVMFIGNTTSIGRGPADKPLFYPSFNATDANIIYAINNLPGSPGNYSNLADAYRWAASNNFLINTSYFPIDRPYADGLVFYMNASQPTSYPQTSTTWQDLSGNNNDTSLLNGPPTYNSNGWLDFDGTNDYGEVSRVASMSPTTGITQEAWIRWDAAQDGVIIGVQYGTSSGNSYALWYDGGSWKGGINTGTFTVISSTTTRTIGKWYHFLHTWDGTTQRLYLNGEQIQSGGVSGTATYNANNTKVAIATDFNGPGYDSGPIVYVNGAISKIRIYNKGLSSTQVKQNLFQSNIVQDGLVMMLDPANLVSYENGATTTYSLTGSMSGSLINGVGFTQNNGGTWNFDGTNDQITISNESSFDFTNAEFALECWFRCDRSTGSSQILINKARYGANGRSFELYLESGLTIRWGGFNGSAWTYVFGPTITVDQWYHLIVTSDGNGNAYMYYNGSQVASSNSFNTTLANTADPVDIGAQGASGAPFDGQMGDVRIYNRYLTPSEVGINYQETKHKFLDPQSYVTDSLQLDWDLGDRDSYPATGNFVEDLTANNNRGTIYNGTEFNRVNWGVLQTDGIDDYVVVGPVSGTGNPAASVTWEVWVNPDDSDGNIMSMSSQNPQGGWNMPPIAARGGVFQAKIWNNAILSDTVGFTKGLWYQLVLVFDYSLGGQYFYVNGVLKDSQTGIIYDASGANNYLFLAQNNPGADAAGNFAGQFGIFRVYNKALSATEVLRNFNASKQRYSI